MHTLIVGATRPGRWRENAALFDGGTMSTAEYGRIRGRWCEVADASWAGQR